MNTQLTPQEAQDIARQAFIYGFPLVENYGLMYEQAYSSPMGFNRINSTARLYGPSDTEVVTPNNDTCYSLAWLDLTGGPIELSVGPVAPPPAPAEGQRYWSFQVIDAFTNNIDYIGLRATGPAESTQTFLFVPAGWRGTVPPGIKKTITCPGPYLFLIGRTQLFGTEDIPTVEQIQAGYVLRAPAVERPSLVAYDPSLKTSLTFFTYMNQVFAFQAPPAANADLMAEFARIDVGPGLTFDPDAFTKPIQEALFKGMEEGLQIVVEQARDLGQIVGGWNMPRVDQEYFGTTWNDCLFRAAIGYKGIYANSPQEALYPIADLDGDGHQLSGADGRSYTMRFAAGQLPPVQFFWSLTMYSSATRLLVENRIDRYSISNRTDGVVMGPDGSLELYLQFAKPEGEAARNWLPAPNEPFYVVLRMYGPEGDALDGPYGNYPVPPLRLAGRGRAA